MNRTQKINASTKNTSAKKTKTAVSKRSKVKDFIPIADNLIIVESPTKARTLGKYLDTAIGKNGESNAKYSVIASGGHIIDLPHKKIGVDIEKNFQPEYEILPDKEDLARKLKTAAKTAQTIYLATDPDREGEAIAWHINSLIKSSTKGDIWRVQFHEITKNAVLEALKHPGKIDQSKVDAQQARRVMDRLVGYQVSPILWKIVTSGLSAGRVQSVALRLICERKREIDAFVSEEYWSIDGLFSGEEVAPFKAKLHKLDGEKPKIDNQDKAEDLIPRLENAKYNLSDIRKSRRKRQPMPPYTTSTLQQDASRRLGMAVKRTMSVAQKLYEGVDLGSLGTVGLITYMRTDSLRISNEAITSARNFILNAHDERYLPASPRVFKNKNSQVQDAHEAIRPTNVDITPEMVKDKLPPQEFRLYDLIWRRFVASQMTEAQMDVTVATITDNHGIEFRASGQVIVFPGFLTVYADIKEEQSEDKRSDESASNQSLPNNLVANMPLDLEKIDPIQHFTQPPPHFSEASLVKELDEKGIGRPSTYATIINTLLDRKYVIRKEKILLPTDLGFTVNDVLVVSFPDVFNVKFTAQMENELDRIETGVSYLQVLKDFYVPFSQALQTISGKISSIKSEIVTQEVGKKCPKCDSELIFKWGRHGRFITCSAFPKCDYSEDAPDENMPSNLDLEPITCSECGEPMKIRKSKFGIFWGCTGYPKCRNTVAVSFGIKCPAKGCSGELIQKKTKRGRKFWACNKYPECNFTSWDNPVKETCPQCKVETIFIKTGGKLDGKKYCSICDWTNDS